jgi:putative GTP pyrophosphokinase
MKKEVFSTRDMITEYTHTHRLYEDFAETITNILVSVLEKEGIRYQTITCRAKDVESLREKIKRKKVQGVCYKTLTDITDLAGARIILYFADDVQKVLDLISSEFIVQKNNSALKTLLEHGYIAEHRIVSLTKARTKLDEYDRYRGLKAEVQIKTILQHAWAEIEHDIGYKPRVKEGDLKRKNIRTLFVQNAKALEKIDKKFAKIRKLHEELLHSYDEQIDQKNFAIPVNYDTVSSYLKKRYKDKFIRKQEVLDILTQAEKLKIKNLRELSQALNATAVAFADDLNQDQ